MEIERLHRERQREREKESRQRNSQKCKQTTEELPNACRECTERQQKAKGGRKKKGGAHAT
jgi:hypothetical protein